MSVLELVQLFKDAGFAIITLVIMFLIIRYFMQTISEFRELINNHLEEQTAAFIRMTETLESLDRTICRLMDKILLDIQILKNDEDSFDGKE